MLLSDRLPESALGSLGLQAAACITGVAGQHMCYLEFHRLCIFRGTGVAARQGNSARGRRDAQGARET